MFQKDFVGDAINTMSLKDRKKLEGKLEKGIVMIEAMWIQQLVQQMILVGRARSLKIV